LLHAFDRQHGYLPNFLSVGFLTVGFLTVGFLTVGFPSIDSQKPRQDL
jgi:hypothetical protein